jgi:beta-alanine--pyruvate transaminase
VMIEPVQGGSGIHTISAEVLSAARQACDRHGALLVFDEVQCGMGRTGTLWAYEQTGVTPDVMTVAKGLTSGAAPMGAVFVRRGIYDTVVSATEQGIEFFHGYTYSGHPLSAAAGLAALDVYQGEELFARAAAMAPYWESAVHSLRGLPHVIDLRNLGLVAGIELEPRPDTPGARGFDAFVDCFEQGVLVRVTGDTIALSPPLIVERAHVDQIFETLERVLRRVA